MTKQISKIVIFLTISLVLANSDETEIITRKKINYLLTQFDMKLDQKMTQKFNQFIKHQNFIKNQVVDQFNIWKNDAENKINVFGKQLSEKIDLLNAKQNINFDNIELLNGMMIALEKEVLEIRREIANITESSGRKNETDNFKNWRNDTIVQQILENYDQKHLKLRKEIKHFYNIFSNRINNVVGHQDKIIKGADRMILQFNEAMKVTEFNINSVRQDLISLRLEFLAGL